MVKIGDKVKLDYISDCNPHNGKIGVIIELRKHKYYPNGNPNEWIIKQSCTIQYSDNSTESVMDTERKGSGIVSPLTVVNKI